MLDYNPPVYTSACVVFLGQMQTYASVPLVFRVQKRCRNNPNIPRLLFDLVYTSTLIPSGPGPDPRPQGPKIMLPSARAARGIVSSNRETKSAALQG